MAIYFISDLHLDESRPKVTQAFYQWLDHIQQQAKALYILGDFFEAWLGDDDTNAFNQDVIHQLSQFSQSGVPVFVMHGNRDFLLGDAFAHQAGATLLAEPSVIDVYGLDVLLMHGDSLCTLDETYQAFRQQVRSPGWQSLWLAKSLEERQLIAANMREESRLHTSRKTCDIMDVTPEEVVEALSTHKLQCLIHGHTHRPDRHQLEANGKPAERIVLGDWGEFGWHLVATPSEGSNRPDFKLEHWVLADQIPKS